jgi:hypothetical protein
MQRGVKTGPIWFAGLKARNMLAQGNALGSDVHKNHLP